MKKTIFVTIVLAMLVFVSAGPNIKQIEEAAKKFNEGDFYAWQFERYKAQRQRTTVIQNRVNNDFEGTTGTRGKRDKNPTTTSRRYGEEIRSSNSNYQASAADIDRAIASYEASLAIIPSGTWKLTQKQFREDLLPPEGGVKARLAEAKKRKQEWLPVEGKLQEQRLAQQQQEQRLAQQQLEQEQARLLEIQNRPEITAQGNNLAEKLNWLRAFGKSDSRYLVEVRANETIDNFGFGNGQTITLRGIGANRVIKQSGFWDELLSVHSGATVILENITLRGWSMDSKPLTNRKALVLIDDGTLIMNNGSAITGARTHGAVDGGAFIMNGGTISGNEGTAVSVGTFTMNGGTISGNDGTGVQASTFTMNGGTISGNTGHDGGGVCVTGTFTMTGGTISRNTANRGGGVYVYDYTGATFTMTGGTISGNTAREKGGGGVYVNTGATFTKTGGTITGYTSDRANGNVVKNESGAVQNFKGHAVYAGDSDFRNFKIRESTAGPGDNLSYGKGQASGAWDN